MTLVAGAFFTLYALQRSYYDFYGDVTMLLVAGMLGVLALAYFVHSMHRSTQPLLNLRGLRNTRYWSGVGLFTACYGLMAATNTMLPSLLQRGFGFPWEVIGRIQAVGLAATVLTWAVAAAILPKKPAATKFYVIGFFALFVFGWKVAHLNPDAELWTDFVPALGCYGVFVMLVLSTTAMQTFREVQHHETVFSHAQQVKNMLAQFGSSLGISLATVGLQIRTTSHYAVLNERFVTGSPDYVRSLQDLIGVFSNGGGQQATQMATVRLGQMLSQQATLMACLDYFLFLGCIGAMVSACMVLQKLFRYAHAAARTKSKG
jgi:hypothetical protein